MLTVTLNHCHYNHHHNYQYWYPRYHYHYKCAQEVKNADSSIKLLPPPLILLTFLQTGDFCMPGPLIHLPNMRWPRFSSQCSRKQVWILYSFLNSKSFSSDENISPQNCPSCTAVWWPELFFLGASFVHKNMFLQKEPEKVPTNRNPMCPQFAKWKTMKRKL